MNYMNVYALESADAAPPKWSSSQPTEDVAPLYASGSSTTADSLKGNATGRRTHYSKKPNRQEVTFKPTHWIDMDFCNGFLDFNTFSLKLPGGLHFSLMKYWDGQVRPSLLQLRRAQALTSRRTPHSPSHTSARTARHQKRTFTLSLWVAVYDRCERMDQTDPELPFLQCTHRTLSTRSSLRRKRTILKARNRQGKQRAKNTRRLSRRVEAEMATISGWTRPEASHGCSEKLDSDVEV